MKYGIAALAILIPAAFACADRSVDETKPAAADGDVEIAIVSGSLTLTGWDRNEIRVVGTLGDDVEEFEFEVDGGDTEIRVKLPNNRRNRDGHARLEISLPSGSSIEAKTISAPIAVRGVYGRSIELKAISGKILVEDCRGEVQADVVSGTIDIAGDHESVEAESVSGSITIDGVTTEVDAQTVSGAITVTAGALRECALEALSGRIRYEGGLAPDGELDIEAFSGAVDVTFSEEVFGDYEIETFNGRIENAFGPEPQRKSRFGPGYEVRFTHGSGGKAQVRINSFNGRVELKNR